MTTNDLPAAEHLIRRWLATGQAFDDGSGLLAKPVIKSDILETKDATLVSERFLGVAELSSAQHPMVRLDDPVLFCLESGGTPSTTNEAFWNGPHAWATLVDLPAEDLVTEVNRTQRNITDQGLKASSAVLLPIGTVVVSTRATLGRVGIARVPLATNQGFKSIIIKDVSRAIPEYVALAVTRLRAKMEEFASGGTFKEISKTNFGHLEIPLPPLEEQRRIATEIEGYQKVLDGARQILAALEHQLHIEPEWERVPLGTICENLDGKRRPITKSDRKPGPYPYYGASGIVDQVEGYIFDEPLLLVSEDGANLLARSTPIAFSVSGKIWVNNHAHVLRFPDMATQRFVEHYLNSISIAKYVTGAAQPKLNQAQLNSIGIPLPSLPEQRRIVAELDAEAAQMEAVRALLPRFEAKVQRVLDRVWGNGESE